MATQVPVVQLTAQGGVPQHGGQQALPVAMVIEAPPYSPRTTLGTAENPVKPELQTTRVRQDTVWFVLFAIGLLVWLVLGFAILGSHNTGVLTGGAAACTDKFPSIRTDDPLVTCVCGGKTKDLCAYAPIVPKECANGRGRRLFTHHRRLDSDDTSWDVFSVFTHYPGYPVALILITACIAVAWVAGLKIYSRPLIHATALLKTVGFVVVGFIYLDHHNPETAGVMFVFAAIFLYIYLKYRAHYDLSARVMTSSCECLGESTGVWRYAILIQVIYLLCLGFYTWVTSQTFNVQQWTTHGDGTCSLGPAGWAIDSQRFMSFFFLWIIYWCNGARLVAVSTSAITWFFHSDDPKKLTAPAATGCKWAFTTSSGTIALGSLIVAASRAITKSAQSKCAWCNPVGCFLKLVFCFVQRCIEAMNKFSLIVHVFTAGSFCESVSNMFNLLKRRFAQAIVVDMAADDCLRLGAYVFSVVMGIIAWAWADNLCDTNTLDAAGYELVGSAVFYVLFFVFIVLTYYPMATIILVSLISPWLSSNTFVEVGKSEADAVALAKLFTPPFIAFFIGAICHIIFSFMANVLMDAIDTVFLCWVIDRDYQACGFGAQALTAGQQEKHQVLYAVLAESDAGKMWQAAPTDQAIVVGHVQAAPAAMPVTVIATAVGSPSRAAPAGAAGAAAAQVPGAVPAKTDEISVV